MFYPEYDAFGEDYFRSQDPVAYYNALYKHVFSKKSKELAHQKQLLQKFKPDYRVKFLTDYRRWRTIFDEIRAITEAATSDADLQQFIDTHYIRDNRQHIVTAIHHARNEDWDFATTLQKICDADDRAPAHTTRQPVYALSKNSTSNHSDNSNQYSKKPTQPCHSYQKGECFRGNNCRYSHDIAFQNDNVTTSPRQSLEMIVKTVLITKMSLVGLMPSVLLRVDAQTPTRTAFQRLREDSSTMSNLMHLANQLHLHLRHHHLRLFVNLRRMMLATSRHGRMNRS